MNGRVVDESGKAVTTGIVRVSPWWAYPGRSSDIGQDGSFVLEVPDGQAAVAVEAIGGGFMSEQPVRVSVSAIDEPVRLVVSREVWIRGRVVDEQGRPLEGIVVDGAVEADAPAGSWLRSLGGLEGYRITKADGCFAFGQLVPHRPYRISAGSDAAGRAEARNVLPGTTDLVLTIPSAKPAAR